MGKYQELEEIEVYQLAVALADRIWEIVSSWSYFARDTVGKQMVRAVDSIAANIAESYGRYHYGDKLNFLYYSRGSLYETKHWVGCSHGRGLMNDTIFDDLMNRMRILAPKLNAYISSKRQQRTRSK
ncbi:MAG: four helix bundle protein [Chloroflexi bacterium]|nr:MAG: four helix bundle protein [Chloroflexota bacterium]